MKLEKEEKIEIQAEQQEKKEIKLIGRQRKINGLTLWEYNPTSKELNEAQYSKQDYELKSLSEKSDQMTLRHKVNIKEGFIYFQALNRKNAEKKIAKRF